MKMVPNRRIVKSLLLALLIGFCLMQYHIWHGKENQKLKDVPSVLTNIKQRTPRTDERIKSRPKKQIKVKHAEKTVANKRVNMTAEMEQRVHYLKQECSKLKAGEATRKLYADSYLKHLLVNKPKKLMYCYVPKIANTNFRRVLIGISDDIRKDDVKNISGYDVYTTYKTTLSSLKAFKAGERRNMVERYRKFLFVREPLEKLLSAYKNKFFHPKESEAAIYYGDLNRFYSKHSILRAKRNITVDLKSRTASFTDFLTYWTDAYEVGAPVNEHFMLVSDLCLPCGVKYDYIGRFESLQRDSDFIFNQLGIDMRLPSRNDNFTEVKTSEVVGNFYNRVPKPIMIKMRKILSIDYRLFGYKLPQWFVNRVSK